MKTFLIIMAVIVVLSALTYFGFIPISGIPRGSCKNEFGDTGYYYMGGCAT